MTSMADSVPSGGAASTEALQNGFPGRTLAGIAMVAAPPLAFIGSTLGISSYDERGARFVQGMVAHPVLFDLGAQFALSGVIVLMVAVIGLAQLVAPARPRLGRTGALLSLIGLCGPVSFESTYWAASHLTDTEAHRGAAALMIDTSQIIPSTVMNVSGPALVVGFVLLAVAAAKAGVLGRTRAIALGATCLIPVGFISGYLAISAAVFVLTGVALVPLGVRLLRGAHGSKAPSAVLPGARPATR